MGHHSTSDDSFAYRPRKEVEDRKRLDNPILRFRLYLEAKGWWTKEEEAALVQRYKAEVAAAYKRAEKMPKPPVEEMFNEVYGGEMPWNLVRPVWFLCLCLRRVFGMGVLIDWGGRCRRSRRRSWGG